ncbi:unnamed protein product [Clonostachys rhizophaga]|uniref:Beta-lactamase-related domain-containing protein n=1 Tax=Clonostachys rhizophaga TaxID=160324 RepID=A0A9N9W0I6_9HYPO|nr:unnamed protein product [Clonostachys rhizophaga]
MAEIDAILQKYTDPETGSIHGASFVAVDANGNDIYRKSFGHQKVDVKNSPPLTLDTVTWIASQTKLTTSVSVMQLVERGLIGLDDDVREVLPQLKELKVLVAFEDEDGDVVEPEPTSHDSGNGPYINKSLPKPKGQPIFEDVKGPITLRHLVTHTSGLCYDLASPLLMKYSAWIGRKENMFSGTIEGFFHPLLFQPGTSWTYGPGLDWAAKVVEKLTGLEFDEYQQKNIWQPLGAKNTTFFPAKRGLTQEDIHEPASRADGKGSQNLEPGTSPWKFECRDALGSGGLFSTANDYSKLLAALLSGGGSLLSQASVDELFRPQIGPGAVKGLRQFIIGTDLDSTQAPIWTGSAEEWQDVMKLQHSLCGVVNAEDVKARRRKNTVHWSGLPNLIWYIDRESGVTATFFTQLLPVGDRPARQIWLDIEEALYKIVNKK